MRSTSFLIENLVSRVNEKINEMIKIVIEDEHELARQEEDWQKAKDEEKSELLKKQL